MNKAITITAQTGPGFAANLAEQVGRTVVIESVVAGEVDGGMVYVTLTLEPAPE